MSEFQKMCREGKLLPHPNFKCERTGRQGSHASSKVGENAHHSKLKSASFSPLSCLYLVSTEHQIMHAYETLVVMPRHSQFVCCLTRDFFEGNKDGDIKAATPTESAWQATEWTG